jgi:hypothetical protein
MCRVIEDMIASFQQHQAPEMKYMISAESRENGCNAGGIYSPRISLAGFTQQDSIHEE